MNTLQTTLVRPVVTEKTVIQKGKFSFIVHNNASKEAIKKALKEFYGVDAEKVNIINLPSKKRIVGRGRSLQKRPELKKAVITLKEGQTIDFNAFK